MEKRIVMELPYPPTVNTYWRHVIRSNKQGKPIPIVLISKRGRAYKKTVALLLAVAKVRPLCGALKVCVKFYPPDKRKRDLDNCFKGLFDSLIPFAYKDDSQIKKIVAEMLEPIKGGRVIIEITKLPVISDG